MFVLVFEVVRNICKQAARTMRLPWPVLFLPVFFALIPCLSPPLSAAEAPQAVVLEIQGAIGPATGAATPLPANLE